MDTKVKICGIRTLEAAVAAVDAGADYLGFNFVPSSKRYIEPGEAKKIIQAVRSYFSSEAKVESRSNSFRRTSFARAIKIVGVFQNQIIKEVNNIAKEIGLDFVQLHGEEDNSYIQQTNRPVIKSFTLSGNPKTIQAELLLLDRFVQGKGDMVDGERASAIAKNFSLFLAGGLTPENVSVLVKKVKPFAVDVAGGVETAGIQDVEKIALFIRKVKGIYAS